MNFFDDLNKLNKDKENDEFSDLNNEIYDEHNFYILSPYKNPEFFKSLCKMCKDFNYNLPSNENGFTQEDLDQITFIDDCDDNCRSYFKNVISLDELQYFHNLKEFWLYTLINCQKLKSVKFPENLEIIHSSSFLNCENLEKIIIPERFKNNMKNIFLLIDLTKINITYI